MTHLLINFAIWATGLVMIAFVIVAAACMASANRERAWEQFLADGNFKPSSPEAKTLTDDRIPQSTCDIEPVCQLSFGVLLSVSNAVHFAGPLRENAYASIRRFKATT
jgi:hypothetical protein